MQALVHFSIRGAINAFSLEESSTSRHGLFGFIEAESTIFYHASSMIQSFMPRSD